VYEAHFGLSEKPFSIAPDPQYLFMSRPHQEAMAHLSYGVQQGGGFILLTGEVGTGKTTLCRNLLKSLPDNVNLALILNAAVQKDELLQSICDELEIKYKKSDSQKTLLNTLNQYLLDSFAKQRKTILIIDEAQLLSRDVLEQIRMLTNLETTKNKLLQIILIGQPELNDILKRQDLRQLAQRVTARYHLNALRREDITEYVTTRLKVAGCAKPIFTKQALAKIHRLTRGIPRLINVLCDHSLIAAYSKDSHLVDVKAVKQGAKDMMLDNEGGFSLLSWLAMPKLGAIAGILASLLIMVSVWYWFMRPNISVDQAAQQSITESATKVDAEETTKELSVDTDNTQTLESETSDVISPKEDAAIVETVVQNEAEQGVTAASLEQPLPEQEQLPITDDELSRFDLLLSEQQANTSRIQAFRNLSELWETPLPSVMLNDFCTEVRQLKLDCYAGESNNLQELALYNRPAILVLENATGIHRVILRGVSDIDAKVQIGQDQVTVARSELEQLWNGKYLLYWQPPAIGYRLLQQGNSGTKVVWLRQQINFALLKNQKTGLDDTVSSVYDEKLSQVVRDIQTSAGIIADGQVGLQTYMIINQMMNDRTIPKLDRLDSGLNAGVSSNLSDSQTSANEQELSDKAL